MSRPAADSRRAVVRRAPVVVASLAALTGTGAILSWLGRGTTFFYDEWNFVERRRTGVIRPLLEGHNGHLSAGPVIVYRVLFATAGLRHYAPYRLTLIGLHLLCAVITGHVTGGQVGDGKGRLDFNLPDAKLDRAYVEAELNRLIAEDRAVRPRWITDEELGAHPELVRTMSVKPPTGQGRVRLLEIEGVDLQPCGGTHVKRTGEIGPIEVVKIESKGKQNRRVNLALRNP